VNQSTSTVQEPVSGGNRAGQILKWAVYILLLVNFGFYFIEELGISGHTLHSGSSFLDWTTAFATTFDELAWFVLLFVFEAETYALSDAALKPWVVRTFQVLRLISYLFLTHTIYAWGDEIVKLETLDADPQVTELCQLVDSETSFTRNNYYFDITSENCGELAKGQLFYPTEDFVYTDTSGLVTAKQLAWIDLVEAIAWLLVLLTIEIALWQQERNITGGRMMMVSYSGKALYGLIFAAAIYWAFKGHWWWTWDELLWIFGFFAIEANMKAWREEIEAAEALVEPQHI